MFVDYSITENIPVSDHVYKYLIKRCGSDVFVADRKTAIGNIVLSSLGKNTDVKIGKKQHTKIFKVVIKEHYYLQNGVYLGIKSGQIFNKTIDMLFREEMYVHLLIYNITNKQNFVAGIQKYLQLYDITEDDLKLDTIYRDFKRKKEQLAKNLIVKPNLNN